MDTEKEDLIDKYVMRAAWKKDKNAQLINAHNKSIYDVLETIIKMKPIYKDVSYKEGYEDCLYLLKKAIRKIEEPNYAIIIREQAKTILNLTNKLKLK